jgi:hypothetical protein
MIPRVLEHVAVVARHHHHRLGDVERRAAAEADDRVGVVGPCGRAAGHRLRAGRIAGDAIEHRDVEAGVAQRRDERMSDRQLRQCAVGDDQRAREPFFAQVRPDLAGGARAEADRGGKADGLDRDLR